MTPEIQDPSDPNTYNLLGRLAVVDGNLARAIGLQLMALRCAPGHPKALQDLEHARSLIPAKEEAAQLFQQALSLEPDIDYHHRSLYSTEPFVAMARVEALVHAALILDPSVARAHAALGNMQSRRNETGRATASYATALMLDYDYAAAHIALAHFYERDADKIAWAAEHFQQAFVRNVLYETHAPHAVRRVLLLKAAGGYPASGHLEWCIDQRRNEISVLYVTADATTLPDLDAYDAVFSAMAETEQYARVIERCIALLAPARKRVLNHPASLKTVRRSELPSTLKGVLGCITPPAFRLTANAVAEATDFPFLIRPVDTHRGDGLTLLRTQEDLRAYLSASSARYFNVAPFVEYRSTDGWYRKYRVIVVGGKPFAYHLAISSEWLVHYWRVTDLMIENAWMRDEEERFLRDPSSVFPSWEPTFRAMADAIGLDYFGVDCTLLPDGTVLVFECDPSAFVHCREAGEVFAYKYHYVPRIFAALDELLSEVGAL